ncbi:hypothetical protein C9374_012324 [Naegleria lovaniensis]|uniref:Uncharacterized protein n=1 Tax=Naegleria lovaniensis TaxID=51637 RepID=A0AA88KEG7_NAELO|nr:uncharacterized protein C9374_012324 [Naegleria lovaniensis]KAG2373221.1 hypothetical protein C9374_012324 [Naegleria lovaniensis]
MTATSRCYLSNHEVLREYFAPVHHDDPPPPLVEDDFYDEDDDPMPLLEDDCDSSESDTYWDDESVGDITAIVNDSYEEVDDLPSLPLVEEELNLYDDLPPLVDDDNVDLAGDMIVLSSHCSESWRLFHRV